MKSKKMYAFLGAIFLPLVACLLLYAVTYRSSLSVPERPMPILMYHHVVDGIGEVNGMTVTVEKLEKDFAYLQSEGYEAVLPQELVSGEIPEKPVMITFDDGYRSNYDLLFPLLRKYDMKAVISVIASMPDIGSGDFCSWEMLREMSDSGLVEIASHTYSLHNLDERNGEYAEGAVNGIVRSPGESIEDYSARVMGDIERSRAAICANVGVMPRCFAYPYGENDTEMKDYIEGAFDVTFTTSRAIASAKGTAYDLPRITVTMDTELEKVLHFVK